MPAPNYARASLRSSCRTLPVFCRTRACGQLAKSRSRKSGRAAADLPNEHAATPGDSLPRSSTSRSTYPQARGSRITWREGVAAPLSSRFARVRVRVAHRDYTLTESRSEEWLLIEWPKGEAEPTKYWLSALQRTSVFIGWLITPSCGGTSRRELSGAQTGGGAR